MKRLPVGVRFRPTEGELIGYFLRHRASMGSQFRSDFVTECPEIFGKTEPWVIWDSHGGAEMEEGEALHFFTQRRRLAATGTRFHRKVGSGTWSGQHPTDVVEDGNVIGVRRDFRYESGLVSQQNNCWLLQEYEIAQDDTTVLCTLRKNSNSKVVVEKKQTSSKKRKQKCGTATSGCKNDGKKAKMDVNFSNPDSGDNAGCSLGGAASGCVNPIIDLTYDDADADSFSLMQSQVSGIDVEYQSNISTEPLASYSSLLASPVVFDDLLCDDAGCSQMQSMSTISSVGYEANEFGSYCPSLVIDNDYLCDVPSSENADSSTNILTDGQELGKPFEGSCSDFIGEFDFSFEDVEDDYLLQFRVIDDDE